ncbi:uncharacterized protein LOC103025535 [Astyanax mexicanus]|uniref:uncharacterized protein LOC103025535 n=1 Tax=Astyanax mexicanus TaxID=7994 RepID=UPI0020CAAEC7|nr:uncharacterized protein LOC103025535 [Astyanax mexicanus]
MVGSCLGPVGCFDVTGYPGGSVLMYCEDKQYGLSDKYFCKVMPNKCINVQTQNTWVHEGRFSLYDSGHLTVIYRDLSVGDAGIYRCGETGVWNNTVKLRVETDPCCLRSKTITGRLGETITIDCSYPEEFEGDIKYFYKQIGQHFPVMISTFQTERDRFSISEYRRSRVFSVRISDVREDDVGVYYCGAGIRERSFSYYTLFTKNHLITASLKKNRPLRTPLSYYPKPPLSIFYIYVICVQAELQSFKLHTWLLVQIHHALLFLAPGFAIITIIIIITVSICVVLLLTGGLTLIFYKLRCSKTQDSPITNRRSRKNDIIHENDPAEYQNIRMGQDYQNIGTNSKQADSIYQSLNPNTNQSDSVYQSLNPNTTQTDSVYQSLNPNTIQSDSVYWTLNPNTNQSDSVFQSLNPNTIQSNSVYQSLNPNTIQSNSVYQSLNPNTIQSNSVYQSLNPNTTQSDSVFQSLNPNTIQSNSVYQSLNPNTIQSDSVYWTLNPNTTQSDPVFQSLNPNTIQSNSVYQSLNPNTIQSDSVFKSQNPN